MNQALKDSYVDINYKNRPKICQGYITDISQVCQRYAKDIPKIRQRYAKDIPKIRQRYAKDMPTFQPSNRVDFMNRCYRKH